MGGMADWHPILATVEVETGVWALCDQRGEYGRIALRRTVDGPRYRCEFRGELIGWATTLRGACKGVHGAYIASHSPSGPPNSGWAKAWPASPQACRR